MANRKIVTTLAVIILFLNFVTLLANAQLQPHDADAMWVNPSNVTFTNANASIGTRFNVTVWLNMTEDIFAYQVALHYNRTQLNCTRAGYTAGSTSNYFVGHAVTAPAPVIDTSSLGNGSVLASESLLGDDIIPGPHSESLIWMEFKILTVPASGNLTSKFDITTEYNHKPARRTWIEDPSLNDLDFTTYDGDYQFVGPQVTPPSAPSISISANSTSIYLGQSVLFTSTVSGGSPPYTAYRWFLNSTAVLGATSSSWIYTPAAAGSGSVYLNVTDSTPIMGQSNVITVTVSPTPPPTGAKIYIDPSQIVDPSLGPSSTFGVNVSLAGVASLSACIFNLTYDPQVLNWMGAEVLRVQTVFPTAQAVARVGSVWMDLNYPTPVEADPPEPIVTIYFRINAYGTSPLNLTATSLLDSSGNSITHSESDGLFSNGKIDVAVTSVVPTLYYVIQGSVDDINITVANLGDFTETFNVSALYNATLIGTTTVNSLPSNAQTVVTIAWNTTGVPAGNYTINGTASILPFEANTTNNVYVDGTVQVTTLTHDVAVTGLTPLRTWAYQGFKLPINVTTKDLGNFTETFNVTLYADNNKIGTFPVNLIPGSSNTTTFLWNTTSVLLYYNYTISAQASLVPQEFNVTNNSLIDGIVSVRLVGDVNGDKTVDGRDISTIARSFGSYGPSYVYAGSPPSTRPPWNADADLNGDNVVDGLDILIAQKNYGEAYS